MLYLQILIIQIVCVPKYCELFGRCSVGCTIEAGFYCTVVDHQSVCAVQCGDGLRAGPELDETSCDDGNLNRNDGRDPLPVFCVCIV
jgi:cysteine-rich repeat protein